MFIPPGNPNPPPGNPKPPPLCWNCCCWGSSSPVRSYMRLRYGSLSNSQALTTFSNFSLALGSSLFRSGWYFFDLFLKPALICSSVAPWGMPRTLQGLGTLDSPVENSARRSSANRMSLFILLRVSLPIIIIDPFESLIIAWGGQMYLNVLALIHHIIKSFHLLREFLVALAGVFTGAFAFAFAFRACFLVVLRLGGAFLPLFRLALSFRCRVRNCSRFCLTSHSAWMSSDIPGMALRAVVSRQSSTSSPMKCGLFWEMPNNLRPCLVCLLWAVTNSFLNSSRALVSSQMKCTLSFIHLAAKVAYQAGGTFCPPFLLVLSARRPRRQAQ